MEHPYNKCVPDADDPHGLGEAEQVRQGHYDHVVGHKVYVRCILLLVKGLYNATLHSLEEVEPVEKDHSPGQG
jgi:hypothetical protein